MKKISLVLSLIILVGFSYASFTLEWYYPLSPAEKDSFRFTYDRLLYGASAALVNLPGVNSVGSDPNNWLEIVIGSDEIWNFEDPEDTMSNGLWRCLDGQGNLEWSIGTKTDESRSSVAICDFYGDDGFPDIIGGTTSGWCVEAMDRFGNFLWTFPSPPVISGPFAWHSSPAVADFLTRPPGLEIVIGCNAYNLLAAISHWGVWCFQADPSDSVDEGIISPGWVDYPAPHSPGGVDGTDWDVMWYRETNAPIISTPCATDINSDGLLEIIIGVGYSIGIPFGSDDGKILCLNGQNGSILWSVQTDSHVTASAAAGDLDGDGDIEVVIGSLDGKLYFIDGDENANGIIDPSEMAIYTGSGCIYSSPAIGDVDGDGKYEVIAAVGDGKLGSFTYDVAGDSVIVEWLIDLGDSIISSPALAGAARDIKPWTHFRKNPERTGLYVPTGFKLHIYITADKSDSCSTGCRNCGYLFDISGDGEILDSVRLGKTVFTSPVVADIDKDCELELVITGANFDTTFPSIDGPDTIFCYNTGFIVEGCENLVKPHIAEVSTEGCSLIYTTVCVYDEKSHYIRGLEINNFFFTENGGPIMPPRLTMLNECPPETQFVDVVFLFDLSGSMDDEIALMRAHVPEFVNAITDVDYRIAIVNYNGCPTEPSGIWEIVKTSFTGPTACDLDLVSGPDIWAHDSIEFACLFDACMEMYGWPWTLRGSGYEDQYGAIARANVFLTYRPYARKVFVLLTDERPIVRAIFCSPVYDETDAGLDSIIAFCRTESIIVIPVTPENGEFVYSAFEDTMRKYYEGYYELGDSTGGAWFDLYASDWTVLVTAIAEEIATDSCCYEFMYPESIFCEEMIDLNVLVFEPSGAFGEDDTQYHSLCPPEIALEIPVPCGGITTCDNLGFLYTLINRQYGTFVESSATLIINDDTLSFDADEVDIVDTIVLYTPKTPWDHADTIVFWIDYIENTNHCASSTPPCEFFVDLFPPEVVSHTPAEGETLTDESELEITFVLFDDFSGVNTSLFNEENVFILHDADTVEFDSLIMVDSLTYSVDGMTIPGEGDYKVCIRNVFDTPDYNYCPPNKLEIFCWNFTLFSGESHVWFGDTSFYPCDTAYIPLFIDRIGLCRFYSLDVWFTTETSIFYPIDVDRIGSLSEDDTAYLSIITPGEMWQIHVEFDDALIVPDTGLVVWLKGLVSCRAQGGDYTSIIIDTAIVNDGFPPVTWDPGFLIVLWRIYPWLLNIHIDRIMSDSVRVLTIGGDFSTTDLYDPFIDIRSLDPVPGEVDAFVTLDDPAFPAITRLQRSIQDLTTPNKWIIKTDSESLTIVHWNPNMLPEGQFDLNGFVDMKRETLFLWDTAEYESLVILWHHPTPQRWDVALQTGWNLISLPAVPTHHSPSQVFEKSLGIWTYEPLTSSFYTPTLLDKGHGYWVYYINDTTFPIAGLPVEKYAKRIYRGWNLIGTLFEPIPISDACSSPEGLLIPPLYQYDPISEIYVAEIDNLYPGIGYWALFFNEGMWSVPSGMGFCKIIPPAYPEWLGTVNIECLNENIELIFGQSQDARDDLDHADQAIPPSPPDEELNFTGAFKRNRIFLNKDIAQNPLWELELNADAKVSFDLPDNVILFLKELDGSVNELSDFCEFYLSKGTYKIGSYKQINLPDFELIAGFPNPFNLTTRIDFTLPRKALVSLIIRDIAGKKVATLLKEELEPGKHSVYWNAQNQSSGIYFVSLSTKYAVQTTRVILVK